MTTKLSFGRIAKITSVPKPTVARIYQQTYNKAVQATANEAIQELETSIQNLQLFTNELPFDLYNMPFEDAVALVDTLTSPKVSLMNLISLRNLDAIPQKGRPAALTTTQIDELVAFVKRDLSTRRLALRDIRRELGKWLHYPFRMWLIY